MATDLDTTTHLFNEIGTMLVHDPQYRALDWAALALVVGIDEEGAAVRMHGYAYRDDGRIEAVTPENTDIANHFRMLRVGMARLAPDGRFWKAALVQIRRDTKKVSFQFESDDPARWNVTPTNYQSMREQLRPG